MAGEKRNERSFRNLKQFFVQAYRALRIVAGGHDVTDAKCVRFTLLFSAVSRVNKVRGQTGDRAASRYTCGSQAKSYGRADGSKRAASRPRLSAVVLARCAASCPIKNAN